jgi:L-alanine-DL-glutamate epimerase-like enolase superfamily enzyme
MHPALHPPERPRLAVRVERLPLERTHQLPGGPTAIDLVVVEITEGTKRGRGEGVPDPRRGETPDSLVAIIEDIAFAIETGQVARRSLSRALPAGAARNAVDCALWDFESKRSASAVWALAGLDVPYRLTTAVTIPFGEPEAMAEAASLEAHRPLLRMEGGDVEDQARLTAIREVVPRARLILDAKGGIDPALFPGYLAMLAKFEVELLVDPVPPDKAACLAGIAHPVPVATSAYPDLAAGPDDLRRYWDALAFDLDSCGGLTTMLESIRAAQEYGLRVLIGSGPGSSLGVAPAVLAAQLADWAVLDPPLRLARDRQPGLRYDGSMVYPPSVSLWG